MSNRSSAHADALVKQENCLYRINLHEKIGMTDHDIELCGSMFPHESLLQHLREQPLKNLNGMMPDRSRVQTNLYEVVYVSDRISSMDDDAIVTEIVYPASRRNRELEITGCLWFDAKRFLQILEGPENAVKTVYEAIYRDTRHTNIRTLSSQPRATRNFERWSMSYVKDPLDPTINVIMSKYQTEAEKSSAPVILKRLRGWMRRRAVGSPASA